MVVTLLMIVVVASLASATARFALNSERSGRADRDRELAFQAAETALADGERDVMGSPTSTRSDDFCGKGFVGFPETGCDSTAQNLGKCVPAEAGKAQSWLAVNWSASGVPVGRFTGGAFYPTQNGTPSWLAANEPRYIVERIPDNLQDQVDRFADLGQKRKYLYLVTAIGYASRADVKVVLQSTLRKASC